MCFSAFEGNGTRLTSCPLLSSSKFVRSPLLVRKVYQSYELCCGDGSGIGDGITPLKSAFDMAGAKCYVELEVFCLRRCTACQRQRRAG